MTTVLSNAVKAALSAELLQWFDKAIEDRLIAVVDKQLTFFLMRFCKSNLVEIEREQLAILICYLSHKMAQGDVCIRLDSKSNELLNPHFLATLPQTHQDLLRQMTVKNLIHLLEKSTLAIVAENDVILKFTLSQLQEIPPIVMVGHRIYWQRMWEDEHRVASYLVIQSRQIRNETHENLKHVLPQAFTPKDKKDSQVEKIDRQKLAGAIALSKSISIISGGPGTGKTTTVAAILLSALRLNPTKRLRILLAAPTGKAAARLTESLLGARTRLILSEPEKEQLALEAVTLHRLLGASPKGDGFRYNRMNPLHGDILIVDEASMIDLRLMSALIDALTPSMRVILLGDKDQLSSVAPGRVLGDICYFGQLTFSQTQADYLAELMSLESKELYDANSQSTSTVGDVIGLLTISRRFHADSKIGQLATAINTQKRKAVEQLLLANQCEYDSQLQRFLSNDQGLRYIDFAETPNYTKVECYEALLTDCIEGFSDYLTEIEKFSQSDSLKRENIPSLAHTDTDTLEGQEDFTSAPTDINSNESDTIKEILKKFNQFRVLASIHGGLFGTDTLNENLILRLQDAKRLPRSRDKHFIGRPILITQNDASLKLFNGDIGVTLRDRQSGQMRVYFLTPTGQLQSVVPSRLPEHETAFVMTVHKSQGSEFKHTLMVLPDVPNPVLTKELVYTAVTRAVDQLTVYSSMEIIQGAIRQLTPRTSGLIDQIQILSHSEVE